jgi:hypothetical protein
MYTKVHAARRASSKVLSCFLAVQPVLCEGQLYSQVFNVLSDNGDGLDGYKTCYTVQRPVAGFKLNVCCVWPAEVFFFWLTLCDHRNKCHNAIFINETDDCNDISLTINPLNDSYCLMSWCYNCHASMSCGIFVAFVACVFSLRLKN